MAVLCQSIIRQQKIMGILAPRGRGKGIATREFSQLMNCTARRGGGEKEKENHEEEGDGEREREVKERIKSRIF